MKYKEIDLIGKIQSELYTELLFNIVSERASGVELVKFSIPASAESLKVISTVKRILKSLKNKGEIQFIADSESFATGSREGEFILNKYSDILGESVSRLGDCSVLVKL